MPTQQEFTELLQPNLLPLNRFVFGMVGNQFDAEDIVQETVVKAFIHFADFRAESKFKTWLMSIAVNEVRTKRRTEFRSRMSYFDFDQLERLANSYLERLAIPRVSRQRDNPDGAECHGVAASHLQRNDPSAGHRRVEYRRHRPAALDIRSGREGALLSGGSSFVSHAGAADSKIAPACR